MSVEIICCLITAGATSLCGYLAYLSNQEHKAAEKSRKETEERAEERRKESLLSLQLMNANCSLTVGTAMAIKRGTCNGEMEQGLKDVQEAMKNYREFHEKLANKRLNE